MYPLKVQILFVVSFTSISLGPPYPSKSADHEDYEVLH